MNTINQAFAAGYAAAEKGASRAPAMSAEFMALVSGPVGSNVEILKAFHAGYQQQCDDEAAAILAE